MLYNDKYADIAARFINWCGNSNTGNSNVANLALDYLNRAQESLLQEAPRGWVYLTKDHVELSLIPASGGNGIGGASGLEYSLPSDLGVLLAIYVDSTGSHKPTVYYNRNGKIMTGFRFDSAFSKSAGYTQTVKFYYTPINTPFCRYQVVLEKFTGSGDEYSAFPADLLLLAAQKIRCADKGLTNEWSMLKADYEEYLAKFKDKNQNVSEAVTPEINDGMGNPLLIPETSLSGGMIQRRTFRRNDMDVVR